VNDLARLRLAGGALCLDLANTVDPREGEPGVDYLDEPAAIAAWGAHAAALHAGDARRLQDALAADPASAAAALGRLRDLREAIHRAFRAIATGTAPADDDLDGIRATWVAGAAAARLARRGAGYALVPRDPAAPDRVAWAAAVSALELLGSDRLGRVHRCASDDCGWLFLDRSRSGTRRWCSMDTCGARAKVRAYDRRQRDARRRAAGDDQPTP
jgi:predicted RNA-binding Zn ribbon-like protein